MAFPVILVNSATGSDTDASGAGPSTALKGVSASTDGTGLVVTLDGSPDLTGVATDGSHVIFLLDTTAGARNFGKITAKDNVAKTVTVSDAFGLSLSGKTWAIGHKRASVGSTTSRKLAENNSGNGDAMPGWVVELQSGHDETLSAQWNWRRSGDFTSGAIVLRGESGAATMPILRFSNNGVAIQSVTTYQQFRDFELKNTNATKTASKAIVTAAAGPGVVLSGLKINDASNKFWKAIEIAGPDVLVVGCDIGNTASFGIATTGGSCYGTRIRACYLHSCAGDQISLASTAQFPVAIVEDCLITGGSADGIEISHNSTNVNVGLTYIIRNCTIHGNTGDGIKVSSSITQVAGFQGGTVENCNLTGNGGYGLNFSNGSPPTLIALTAGGFQFRNCNTGTGATANTSGACSVASLGTGLIGVDPGYVNTGSANYACGIGVKALGYPDAVIAGSGTRSYMDIGVAQRAEAGGGSRIIGG